MVLLRDNKNQLSNCMEKYATMYLCRYLVSRQDRVFLERRVHTVELFVLINSFAYFDTFARDGVYVYTQHGKSVSPKMGVVRFMYYANK